MSESVETTLGDQQIVVDDVNSGSSNDDKELEATIQRELEQRVNVVTQNDPTIQRLQGMLDILQKRVSLKQTDSE
jgi:hypothetical protein